MSELTDEEFDNGPAFDTVCIACGGDIGACDCTAGEISEAQDALDDCFIDMANGKIPWNRED